jgi:hypothetical protein
MPAAGRFIYLLCKLLNLQLKSLPCYMMLPVYGYMPMAGCYARLSYPSPYTSSKILTSNKKHVQLCILAVGTIMIFAYIALAAAN